MRIAKELMEIWLNKVCDKVQVESERSGIPGSSNWSKESRDAEKEDGRNPQLASTVRGQSSS